MAPPLTEIATIPEAAVFHLFLIDSYHRKKRGVRFLGDWTARIRPFVQSIKLSVSVFNIGVYLGRSRQGFRHQLHIFLLGGYIIAGAA
jgi:hypothetical protein